MDEAKHLIELTVAETEPEIVYELVRMQVLRPLWQKKGWEAASQFSEQRVLVSVQVKN